MVVGLGLLPLVSADAFLAVHVGGAGADLDLAAAADWKLVAAAAVSTCSIVVVGILPSASAFDATRPICCPICPSFFFFATMFRLLLVPPPPLPL